MIHSYSVWTLVVHVELNAGPNTDSFTFFQGSQLILNLRIAGMKENVNQTWIETMSTAPSKLHKESPEYVSAGEGKER